MSDSYEIPRASRAAVWTGWVLGVLPCLLLLFSAYMKFMKPPEVIKGTEESGWPVHLITTLGVLELTCTVIYLVPRTAVLGAVLLTGYLGGAVSSHVRLEDGKWFVPAVLAVLLWLGLFLRDRRLRVLLPVRTGRF